MKITKKHSQNGWSPDQELNMSRSTTNQNTFSGIRTRFLKANDCTGGILSSLNLQNSISGTADTLLSNILVLPTASQKISRTF